MRAMVMASPTKAVRCRLRSVIGDPSLLPSGEGRQEGAEAPGLGLAVSPGAGRRVHGHEAAVGGGKGRHRRPRRAELRIAAPGIVGTDAVVVGTDAPLGDAGVDD